MKTFYWHDYETWGAMPSIDRPSQFAGVRTDEDLNIIGEPLVIYCKPPEDLWPHPAACLITGISPQHAEKHGLLEHEFIRAIHAELARPQTCGVGYNSIRFDDEVTRYTLYRNFYDPYEREWRNGNSRWDIIDMVRLVYALRPEGIEWPVIDGLPSFKLENLTAANNLSHDKAHDAYSDVEATIQLARLIKEKQGPLYQFVVQNKSKQKVAAMLDLVQRKPLFHISAKFGLARACSALVAPIVMHPTNNNSVIVFDLNSDPSPLLDLTVEEISERVFTKASDLAQGIERLPLKEVHLNKSPILTTIKLCDTKAAQRLNIDKDLCEKNWQLLRKMNIADKISQVFSLKAFPPRRDPEQRLYDGFCSDSDKVLMRELRQSSEEDLKSRNFIFEDPRLNDMLLRYKARNFPESLDDNERAVWREFVDDRLTSGAENALSQEQFLEELNRLKHPENTDFNSDIKTGILSELTRFFEAKSGLR